MRLIKTPRLHPGMIIAKQIYDNTCHILLQESVVLTERYIKRLIDNNISEVYIDDEVSKGIQIKNILDEKTKMKSMKIVKNTFVSVFKETKMSFSLPNENISEVSEIINKMIEDIIKNKDILLTVSNLISSDLYTYEHSVNVATLSILIGLKLGYNNEKLKALGIGALLHDIGKVNISNEILDKPDKLTDEEFFIMKKHSSYGYDIIKNIDSVSKLSKKIILEHHERLDGTGYPNGIKARELCEEVRIVSIADVFDAITSDRVYRKKMKTYNAVELIYSQLGEKLDKQIFEVFIKNITLYRNGDGVILSDKRKGIVVRNTEQFPLRPVIKIIYDKYGVEVKSPEWVNLMDNLTLFIEDVIEL